MSKSVFTPEKVRELAKYLHSNFRGTEQMLTEWFEQNQPEPIVVGISDEQVSSLQNFLANEGAWCSSIQRWLKTQSFSHPVTKEVPVGLSDEQIAVLAVKICWSQEKVTALGIGKIIHTYLDTQTFVQPEPPLSNKNVYDELYQEHQEVKNELEQFKKQLTPNWKDAPKEAKWVAQDANGAWYWFYGNNKPITLGNKWQSSEFTLVELFPSPDWKQTLQQRPKPTPQVEVGQVWNAVYDDDTVEVEVIALNDKEVIFQNKRSKAFNACSLSDFPTEFKRVGGSE